MSRIGRKPVPIPEGVEVKIGENNHVVVKGKLGTLEYTFHPSIRIEKDDNQLKVERSSDDPFTRAIHGTTRALLANMVEGVTNGFTIELELVGIGYRGQVKGNTLELQLGYSHPVIYPIPDDVKITMEGSTIIKVFGIDKQRVGQVAAEIRALRKPDPYKGKGVRYRGEHIKLKPGKAAGKK